MKKLATVLAAVASLAIAAPAFACPNMDKGEAPTPRTADKPNDKTRPADTAAKTPDAKAPAKADSKAADPKPGDAKKPGDKVSSR